MPHYNLATLRASLLRYAVGGLVALAVIVGYWWLRSPETTHVRVGDEAPDLALPSLGADESVRTRLSAYRGRPVLLVFFFSKCDTCRNELPEIERLHRELLQKGLRVVAVSADNDRSALEALVREQALTFLILLDPNGAAMRAAWGSWKLPEAYLIDAAGRVQQVWLGSVNWRSPEVREPILREVGKTPR